MEFQTLINQLSGELTGLAIFSSVFMVASGVYRYCYLTFYKGKSLADIPLEVTLLTKTVNLKTETHNVKLSLEPRWNDKLSSTCRVSPMRCCEGSQG